MLPVTGIFITKQFILACFSITKKFSFIVLCRLGRSRGGAIYGDILLT
jgi:hypothetical protein